MKYYVLYCSERPVVMHMSSQTASIEVEEQFFHDEEYEEFSDETLFYAEALGTENIFNFENKENPLNYNIKGNKMKCNILEKMST